jgi:hypothetical protein
MENIPTSNLSVWFRDECSVASERQVYAGRF